MSTRESTTKSVTVILPGFSRKDFRIEPTIESKAAASTLIFGSDEDSCQEWSFRSGLATARESDLSAVAAPDPASSAWARFHGFGLALSKICSGPAVTDVRQAEDIKVVVQYYQHVPKSHLFACRKLVHSFQHLILRGGIIFLQSTHS
jgi:hypothetical protein